MMASLRNVRESPALASWFATTQRPIGAEMAEQSEVIKALTEAFVISLGPDDPDVVAHRARWLVRVMTSLLLFPGHDEADERAMLEEFVVPMVRTEPSRHPIGLRLDGFARDLVVLAEHLGTARVVRLSHATQPKWSEASNADEATASTSASPAFLRSTHTTSALRRHRQLLVVVVAGLQEHPGRGVADRRRAAS